MSYAHTPLRPGLTAIAAVLALSSTPLIAQTADPAPAAVSPSAQPMEAPAPVTSTPAAQDAVAPAPAASASPQQSAAPAALNIPKITVNMDQPATVAEAAPATQAPAEPANARKPLAKKTSAPQPISEKPIAAAPVVAPQPPVETATATPMDAPAAMPTPVAPVAEAAPAAAPSTPVVTNDDVLPIAGAVGIGALALVGGAFAFGRRKRRNGEEPVYELESEEMVVPAVQPAVQPVVAPVAPVVPAPMQAAVQDTSLPAGFDISRFGPHVQAAYRGPTSDNPSLSLRARLKRARFYDQRERQAAEGIVTAPLPETASPQRALPERWAEYVHARPAARKPVFRPAYQS